jgi:hypothetical protein
MGVLFSKPVHARQKPSVVQQGREAIFSRALFIVVGYQRGRYGSDNVVRRQQKS